MSLHDLSPMSPGIWTHMHLADDLWCLEGFASCKHAVSHAFIVALISCLTVMSHIVMHAITARLRDAIDLNLWS